MMANSQIDNRSQDHKVLTIFINVELTTIAEQIKRMMNRTVMLK